MIEQDDDLLLNLTNQIIFIKSSKVFYVKTDSYTWKYKSTWNAKAISKKESIVGKCEITVYLQSNSSKSKVVPIFDKKTHYEASTKINDMESIIRFPKKEYKQKADEIIVKHKDYKLIMN